MWGGSSILNRQQSEDSTARKHKQGLAFTNYPMHVHVHFLRDNEAPKIMEKGKGLIMKRPKC